MLVHRLDLAFLVLQTGGQLPNQLVIKDGPAQRLAEQHAEPAAAGAVFPGDGDQAE